MIIKTEQLYNIKGGAITASFLNSVVRIFTTVIDLGKMIGSTLRRVKNKNYC